MAPDIKKDYDVVGKEAPPLSSAYDINTNAGIQPSDKMKGTPGNDVNTTSPVETQGGVSPKAPTENHFGG